ncbi:MAG TPA: hypothetical protein PJ991_02460, partial [Kiritimatiellia bacterium]|nr:hypothetical protein [Kiritimatiellia bacterium]
MINKETILQASDVAVATTDPRYPSIAPFHPSQFYPEYQGPLATEPNGVYHAVRMALKDLELDA